MEKEMIDNNPILKLSFEFSLVVIDYCEKLEADRKYVIARQLLKSATSIGANAMEAQGGESKADFIHKIKIASKEALETQYWLMLCDSSQSYPACKYLLTRIEEIQRVLNRILSTSKTRNPLSYLLSCFIF